MSKITTVHGKVGTPLRAGLAFAARVLPIICFLAVTISIYAIKPLPKATESLYLDMKSWTYLTVALGYFTHPLCVLPILCVMSGFWAKKTPGILPGASCVLLLPAVLLCSLLLWLEWLHIPPGTMLRV